MNKTASVKVESANPRGVYKALLKSYPDVLNVEQMCEALGGLSKKTGYKILSENRIPSIKVGRAHRILKVNVIAYLSCGSI